MTKVTFPLVKSSPIQTNVKKSAGKRIIGVPKMLAPGLFALTQQVSDKLKVAVDGPCDGGIDPCAGTP